MDDKFLLSYAIAVTVVALGLGVLLLIVYRKRFGTSEKRVFSKVDPLTGLSHEIRTPLNVIIGFSDMLISSPGDPRSQFYLESISTAGRSLLHIVNDVLDFAKIESGTMSVSYSSCSLSVIFKEMDQIFRLRFEEKNLSLTIDNRVEQSLMLDEMKVRQIIINLITNAIKNTDSGGIKLGASLELINGKQDLILTVEDSGRGICKRDIEKIFTPFEQSAKERNGNEGFGLGLAICRRLTDLMSGNIQVESVEGRGSVFTVTFFNIRLASPSIPRIQDSNNDGGAIAEFSRDLVLVVDDNFSNSALLSEYLKKFNLSTITGTNGREAIELATARHPSLILMDIRMPVMDGYEAAKIIKKNKATASIPIVAITASIHYPGRRSRQDDLLFDDYLVKPLRLPGLIKLIEKYILSKKSQRSDVPAAPVSGPEKRLKEEASGDFLAQCRELYIPRIADLKEVIIYSDLIGFSKELFVAGEKEEVKALMEYAEELQLLVKSFNMGRIRHRLDDLASILQQKD